MMNTILFRFCRVPRLRFVSQVGLLLTALLLTVAPPTVAQSVDLLLRGGGTGDDEGQATATDAAGNVYVTGYFSGTATIGGTQMISAGGRDIFVAKYNASGVLQWLRRAGGSGSDEGYGIAVDASGVYVTGYFSLTANFNTPSNPATNTLTSAGDIDIFVAKFDPSGVVQWQKRAGGGGGDIGLDIAVDASGVYVTGEFAGTANFNTPASPASNTLVSAGVADIFVAKYTTSGTVQWQKRAGGSDHDRGRGIAVDASGVYVMGYFEGTANFNTPASPASNTLVSAGGWDIFVAKFDPSGVVQWLQRAGGSSDDQGRGIAVDANGVYITGSFRGTADFNTPTSPASNTLVSVGSYDIFVAKYNPSGVVQWQKRAGGGNGDVGIGIAVDASGVYVSGGFENTPSFDISANNTLTSAGDFDIFVAAYTTSGAVQWLRRAGGSSFDISNDIAANANGVYVTGLFFGTANFNTPSTSGTNELTSAGNGDLFLARFTLADPAPTLAGFAPTATTVCAGNVATFTATVGNVTGAYDFTLTNGSSPLSGTATGAAFSQTLTASGSGVQTYSLIVSDNNSTTFASTTLTVDTHPDYQALVDLYNSTNGPGWTTRTGWLNGCNPCTGNGGSPWFRVTCTNGRVTQLQLNGNQLSGSIPNSLSALTNLQLLQLGGNLLSGSIPNSLSALPNLTVLSLGSNNLSGPIPDGISSLTNLQLLSLFSNQLSGPIPDGISSLTNLQLLQLFSNQLTGNIPSSLSALTNLTQLQLGNNQLSGSIPTGLSSLTNLTGLDLRDNQLSGCYPASLTVFCGITTAFRTNTALPGGGSAASFSALCSSGAGSDAFVAAASAGQTTALVGSVLSLSVNGGSTASFSWLAPAGANLGTPTTTSVIAATLTTAGVKTFTVTVGFGSSCTSTATVSVTGIPTCVSSFTVDDLGEGADASPGDGICATAGGVCTLRAAMEEVTALNCPGPYTITVGVSGTINLTSALPDIVDDVTFLGPGAANLTVRRSSGVSYRIFTIPNSNTVSFSGFTMSDGRSGNDGGGGISNRGNLTLTNCVVRNNVASGAIGGGIYNTGQLALINTSFSSNTAALGGGLYSDGGSSTLTSCSFVTNQGVSGGGIYNRDHTATLSNCVLQSNTASNNNGGGLYSLRGSSTLTSCSLIANRSGDSGGGISNDTHAAILSNCLFQSNTARFNGGGISNNGGSSTLTSCSLIANQNGTSGGGIFGFNHTASISNSLFQSNTATNEGGGILNSGGSSTLTSCSLIANQSGENGGGISTNNHTSILSNCLLQGNRVPAFRSGGGISNTGGSSTLTSCSLIANQSGASGGGFRGVNHTASISNSLFQSNTAVQFSGGGILNSGGSSTLTSCSLIANRSGENGGGINSSGSHTATLTNSLIQSNTATGLGGGIYNSGGSSRLTSCSLVANQSGASGGGVGNDNSHITTLSNCVLQSNTATNFGGGIICFGGSTTLLNGSFENNGAGSRGGAVHIGSGTHILTNVSFRGNSAPTGTVFFLQSGTTQLTNGVLFGNGTPGNGIANGTLQATFSLFEQNTSGFTADPTNLTTAVSPFANPTGTQLNACSPAIDAGSNAAFTGITGTPAGTDLAGNPRFFDGGTGTPARIDMGAYEFQGVGGSLASFSVLGSGTATCAQSPTITLSGSQTGVDYQLQRDGVNTGGAVAGTGAALSFGPQSLSGVYSVLATNPTSSCTALMAQSATVVSGAEVPSVSIAPISGTLTCAVTSLTLTATSSGTGLLWSNIANTNSILVNTPGIYSVTATGANGCSAVSNSVVIGQNIAAPASATLSADNSETLTCSINTLTLTASAVGTGLSYVFAGSTGALAGSGNTRTVSTAGTYSVTITGANGCSITANTTVFSNTATPTVSIAPTSGTLTCAAPSLTLTASTSGTGVRWNTNQITPSIVVSTSGTYSVTATAANGCTSSTNVTVNTDLGGSSPVPTLSASASVVCAGANVIVVATVGGTPSGLQWYRNGQPTGQTSATLSLGGVQVAQAGSYVLVVTGGCSVTSTAFTLTVNPLPTVTLSFPTSTTVIGPGTGTATITLPDPLPAGFDLSFGAFGAVFYERVMIIDRINGYEIRSVDSSTGRFAITRPGPFTITATDANGCRQTVQGVITNLPAMGR